MRFWIGAAATLALASCGDPAKAPSADATSAGQPMAVQSAAAPEFFGIFLAGSTTAMAVAGDAEVDDATVTFAQGLRYETKALGAGDLDAAIAQGPETLRTTFGLGADQMVEAVELREVAVETVAADAPNKGLCGDAKTTFLALAISRPEANEEADGSQPTAPQYLWIAAFTGPDRPGPRATASQLCGTFLFLREIAT